MRGLGRLRQHFLTWRREHLRLRALAATGSASPTTRPRVTIARIIGNDLWPRHAEGQTLANLAFILTNEPDFAGCRKLFVLNRIFDDAIRAKAEEMVTAAGHSSRVLPFSASDYAKLSLDTSYFGGDTHFLESAFSQKSAFLQGIEQMWAAAPKMRYVMNVNAARNAALDWGSMYGDWTLVLDGHCFLTEALWQGLLRDITTLPFAPYLVIPLHRLTDNAQATSITPDPKLPEEPQLAFHSSAEGRFDPGYPYGMRDKTSLLDKIGVPGAWNFWGPMPWLPADPSMLHDRYRWKRASVPVFRLSSGVQGGGLEQTGAQSNRYQSRTTAIFRTLALLDSRIGTPDRDRARAILGLDKDHF